MNLEVVQNLQAVRKSNPSYIYKGAVIRKRSGRKPRTGTRATGYSLFLAGVHNLNFRTLTEAKAFMDKVSA